MEKKFIMTAFGKDRPGIVADVSEVIYENGCNLEDSTMTRLADEFTLILLLSGQDDDLEASLIRECRRLEREKRISAFVRPVEVERPAPVKNVVSRTIRVEGMDQAGIVYKISRYLAENAINIESLTTRMSFSPQSGAALYNMKIETLVPENSCHLDIIRGMERISNDLNVDITVS